MTFWERRERHQVSRRLGRAPEAPADRPRPDLPVGTDLLPQIRHIVVLMMENHSFDNYLGLLGHGDGFPVDADGRPTVSNPDGRGGRVAPSHLTGQRGGIPTQTWRASHLQYADGTNEGFVTATLDAVPEAAPEDAAIGMGYWTPEDLPFYAGLARTFSLADRWFCSCLGPTFPNRRFLIAGTAHGLIDDQPFAMIDRPENGTMLDLLTHHGISWANYHPVHRLRVTLPRLLGWPGLAAARALGLALAGLFPRFGRSVIGNLQFTADVCPLGLAGAVTHLRDLDRFFTDAAAGTLPDFCLVDPDFNATSEENPQDVQAGEQFAARIVQAVMHGKGWPHTLLLWLYDEHGGYYDHVVPPAAVAPDEVRARRLGRGWAWLRSVPLVGPWLRRLDRADEGPDTYERLGFRVPAVAVSPYARAGQVNSTCFDHTSVLRLVEDKWNLPPLTRRDMRAASPVEMLDLVGEPAFLSPPVLPQPARGI